MTLPLNFSRPNPDQGVACLACSAKRHLSNRSGLTEYDVECTRRGGIGAARRPSYILGATEAKTLSLKSLRFADRTAFRGQHILCGQTVLSERPPRLIELVMQ